MTANRLHVVLRCDAGMRRGVGHLVRGLALADELLARGARVTLVGTASGPQWLQDEIETRGIKVVPPPPTPASLARLMGRLQADAVVLDGYDLDPTIGATLRRQGVVVLAVLDGPFGADQAADLYLDQNLGAQAPTGPQVPDRATALLGLPHALFRDQVLQHRGGRPPQTRLTSSMATMSVPPRVLAVFGGTDATSAAPVIVPLLLATGRPVHVVAVAATPEIARAIGATVPDVATPGQSVEVIAPTPELARLASGCDAAVSAAGTSLWELLCLGVPTALVAVADNQRVGHDVAGQRGVAIALGSIDDLRADHRARDAAVAGLDGLLGDPGERRRLSRKGVNLVDGQGRVRVVDALVEAVTRSALQRETVVR